MLGHLQSLVEGPPETRRQAIKALIADQQNKDAILDQLAQIIRQQAQIVHQDTPAGLKPGEPEKYAATSAAAVAQQAAIQAALGILGPDGLLDDERFVRLIDKTGMLERLAQWPEHITCMCQEAASAAQDFRSRHPNATIDKVKIFGLGGSGAPHDIASDIIRNWRKSSTEIEVVHADDPNTDYLDQNTLAILSSFSGNTEETIHCYEKVKGKTPLLVALTRGGKLREIAGPADNLPLMQIPCDQNHPAYVLQPRESVCLQMTATLALLAGIGLKPGSQGSLTLADLDFQKAISLLRAWRRRFGPKVPFPQNPAKRLAFFLLYGIDFQRQTTPQPLDLWAKKVPLILVDRNNRAIGHEPRTQMHERSKLNAACCEAPELLHNLVESIRAGTESSLAGLDDDRWVYYFIRSADEEPRIRFRRDKTVELVIQGKAKYAVLDVEGETPFQRALFATYFHAHMTTYLALLNGYDPLPVPTMSWIKNVMDQYPRGGAQEQEAQARGPARIELH